MDVQGTYRRWVSEKENVELPKAYITAQSKGKAEVIVKTERMEQYFETTIR